MADNNRGRPVMMTEIFILLAGNKKFPKVSRYRTDETNPPRSRTQGQQNRPERTSGSAQQNQHRNSGRTSRTLLQ